MKKIKETLFGITLVLVACSSDSVEEKQTEPTVNSQVVALLNQTINIMEANSVNRNAIDWADFRNQVFDRAAGAQNISQADSALELALALLGDNHSFIRKPNGSTLSSSNLDCAISDLGSVNVPENVGYIKVNSFSGDEQAQLEFAEAIQRSIENQDSDELLGWIVDLRNNTGGNMWPMLAGVGPILGDGIAGYFVYPDNSRFTWSYSDGAAIVNLQTALVTVNDPYVLRNPNPKVAVLLNKAVASSGEAIAVSFVGRANTRFFGSETCGISTSNEGFSLNEGYRLLLTTSIMADRNQNQFGIPIPVDVGSNNVSIIEEARAYLTN